MGRCPKTQSPWAGSAQPKNWAATTGAAAAAMEPQPLDHAPGSRSSLRGITSRQGPRGSLCL
eukprot:13624491-Alexandrium_andersonii.AAC.1